MDTSTLDRQGLLDYIETLEAKTATLEEKMEDLKAQVDLLNMDMEDFSIPEGAQPELRVSEQTADALSEAASLFGEPDEPSVLNAFEELPEELEDDLEVEPAPVKNGVVTLGPVTEEESYIPVDPEVAKRTVRVKVKRKKA